MNVKRNYEESWKSQRLREQYNSTNKNSFIIKLREKLTKTRYKIAFNQVNSVYCSSKNKAYADIGCGRGEMIRLLGGMFESTFGLDVSSLELNHLKKSLDNHSVTLIDADLNGPWPLQDSSYDLVTCIATLEHLFDPLAAAGELARICKPGGHVLIEVPNIAYWEYRLSILFGKFPSTSGDPVGWDGGHLHYFTIDDLRRLFNPAGFRIIDVKAGGLLAGFRSLWPSMLGRDVSILMMKS